MYWIDSNFQKDIGMYLTKSVVKRAMSMKEFWQPDWPDLKYPCDRNSCCHGKNSVPLLLRSNTGFTVLCAVRFVLFMFYSLSYCNRFMKLLCMYVNRYIWSSTSISPYNQLSKGAQFFKLTVLFLA
jgi:hypothetical protein